MKEFDFAAAMPYAANTLYARLRHDAGPDWMDYVGHPFVQALADATLPREKFLAWMVQDYLYLIHYARAYALLVYKSDTVARMRGNATILFGLLTKEMALHRAQLHAEGISETELEATAETLPTLAYARYVLDRAQTGDALDLVVTLSPCLAGYAEIGLRLRRDRDLGDHPYRDWIETYGGIDYQELAGAGLQQMEALSRDYGGEARYGKLLRQFVQATRLETAFWGAGQESKKVLF